VLIANYSWGLVALSLVVSVASAWTLLTLVARVSQSSGRLASAWLFGGAAVLGLGFFAADALGVLALRLPVPMRYDVERLGLAALVALLTSGLTLAVASGPGLDRARVTVAATSMGAGLSAVHFVALSALDVVPDVDYDRRLVVVAVAVAVAAAYTALTSSFALRQRAPHELRGPQPATAAVLGVGLAASLFAAVAGARFAGGTTFDGGIGLQPGACGVALFLGVTVLMSAVHGLALVDACLARRQREHAETLARTRAELEFRRRHDPATGLPSRGAFAERLQARADELGGRGGLLGVVALGLDRFALVNDSLGHGVGDLLLRAVGERLGSSVHHVDLVARGDGDQFLVLVAGVPDRTALEGVARDLLASFSVAFALPAVDLFLSPSIGVAVCPDDGGEAEALLAHANEAMRAAKADGGHQVRFFEPGARPYSETRLDLENDLHRALARDEFELVYQPKVDVRTGRIRGLEALLRWHHPVRGPVAPSEFIPVAEESRLIVPIGRFVLREACRQLRVWRDAGLPPVGVAINVSPVQFRASRFADEVRDALATSGIDPGCLTVEVTETAVMTNAESSVEMLSEIRRLGVRVAIDDFGTGYSSMNYLRRLPIHELKIDRSFVQDVAHRDDARSIVQAIVMLGIALRLTTVAEGVETADQRDVLIALGCDQLQGYLTHAPLSAADVPEVLRRNVAEDGGGLATLGPPRRLRPVGVGRSAAAKPG
jgi:diguanylate cyclase (GGDEF)-like protein